MAQTYKIAVLPGDGIGLEIVQPALDLLHKAAEIYGFEIEEHRGLIGGCAIDATGSPLPEETLAICKDADGVLLGAVGGPQWDNRADGVRPEQGLLKIRKELGLFANLRPAIVYPALQEASPLKAELLKDGLDILVVRELTGGIYFGEHGRETVENQETAYDVERYSTGEIRRIAEVAFDLAAKRGGRLCSVDKANVLESSRLWRQVVNEVAKDHGDIALSHMYVDNAAMQLVRCPAQFDVLVTSNLFGDILSDEASQITGSIGLLPSASLGSGKLGLYEPIHGSAPDIAGKDIANPIATILSVAMLLRYSCNQPTAADAIEEAVNKVITAGWRTADIADGGACIGTKEMGKRIMDALA